MDWRLMVAITVALLWLMLPYDGTGDELAMYHRAVVMALVTMVYIAIKLAEICTHLKEGK